MRLATLLSLARSPRRRAEWQRERFFNVAARYTPVIAVDDRRGNRYFLNTSDYALARGMFMDGGFETGNLDNVLELLAARGIVPEQVVDVGANVGTASVDLLSRLPQAKGVAIEPDAVNYGLLTQNLLANGLSDRVVTRKAAVSDEDGHVSFQLSPQHPGDHRVRVRGDSGRYDEASWEVTEVPAVRLDALVADGTIDPAVPTLLWIDAQGHDAHVLAGALTLRHVPVVVEFWPYALERAGRLDAFYEIVGEYATLMEITATPREMSADAVRALGAELGTGTGYRDLLLIP